MTVSDHDERAEAQVLAALHDLRDTVDRDNGVFDVELRSDRSSRECVAYFSELQPGFPGGISHCLNPAVIKVAIAVEHDLA